jgi:hypothetical protein
MVVDKVCCLLITIILAIILFVSKTFLSHHLLNEDGKGPMKLFKGEKLDQMLLKFVPLCSLSIRNLIVSLKHHPSTLTPLTISYN